MKNITVYTAPATTYYHFLDPLLQSVRAGRQDFLAIVPVNRAVRRLKRLLVDQAKNQALPDPPVFTFDQLLLELYRSFPNAKRLISREIFLVLIKDILNKHAEEFSYFMPEGRLNDGLVQKVADAVNELRNFGYDSAQFFKVETDDREKHPQKYQAFGKLLILLEEQFGEQLIDEPFARAQAAEHLTEALFRKRFPKVKTVYISGYGLFSPPMLTFIERVSDWLPVQVKLDYLPQNQELFSHTQDALHRLQKIGAVIKSTAPERNSLAAHLFNRSDLPEESLPLSDRIFTAGLANREQEVKFIAGQIRALNRQGIALHNMAVTFSHLEKYVPLLRRIFEDYGIPYNLSTGFEIAKAPLIASFLGLFSLLTENFPMEKTLGLLSSPLVKTGEEFNVNLMRQICLKTRTTHLNSTSLQRTLRIIEQVWTEADEEQDELPDAATAREQVLLLQQILKPLYEFPQKASAVDFRTRFLELLNHYDLVHWYKLDYKHLSERQKESSFRAYNRFVKIFERTIWTLQIIYGQDLITLDVLFGALQSALERELYNLTEWQDYGVQIMPRLEILAVNFQVLFVGGLIDGDFPRASVKDIFFGDEVRSAMGLVASEELLGQDRFLFYELLDSPAERVFLTFPKYRDEEALVPSSFLADLKDVAQVTELNPKENDPLFTNRQTLWEDFGQNIFFLTTGDRLQKAMHQADLLFTLLEKPRKTLEDLLHRIQFASLRIMGQQFTRFEGNLTGNAAITDDLQQRFKHRVWSVSQLETYGFCPMQFFLRYVLKIRPTEKIEEEITPLERGSLVHKILYRFYSELLAAGQANRPLEFRERLFAIAREEFDRMPYEGLFWELEKLRYFGNEQAQGIFDVFLIKEQARLDKLQAQPSFFELAFGYSGNFPMDVHSQKQPVIIRQNGKEIRLQGRIDRVDVLPDGGAMIIDYKTGLVHSKVTDIVDGIHFQLPLYLYVLPKLNRDLFPVYGGLYQLKSADTLDLKPIIADKNNAYLQLLKARSMAFVPNKTVLRNGNEDDPFEFDDLLEYSVQQAFEKTEALRQGYFLHSNFPDDRRCSSFCDYRRICQKVTGKLKKGREKEPEGDDS